ncbi:glycosyltransferase family 9 protein [Leptospirillum ferriphilum]|uniref:Heptosyltransferase-2 n=2 Tax=Leptospirillum ferriphilum TaxID=178606 RepID=A0A2I2MJ21_9BACT|nr:glycosyltransferase family 9 protein [Leptospirillum ferriphilum]
MNINIIKPDHLGDLVLSSPAIKVLAKNFPGSTLWCSPLTYSLAKFLFKDTVDIKPVEFPHLVKHGSLHHETLSKLKTALTRSELNVFLRRDPMILDFVSSIKSQSILIRDDNQTHQTILDRNAILSLTGDYSRSKNFFLGFRRFPSASTLKKIGLVAGVGFINNAWPESYWARLCYLLLDKGLEVYLIGSNDVLSRMRIISDATGLGRGNIILCDSSFRWVETLKDLDLIVSGDGGTAHICSLMVPVISIFGPSPWRRFAPFGAQNVVLTRSVSCSPCPQFTKDTVNCCMYRHCLLEILPDNVYEIIDFLCFNKNLSPLWGKDIFSFVGTSHLSGVMMESGVQGG